MKILKERWLTNAKPKQLEKKREKLVKQKKKILEIAHWFKSNGMFSYELFKLYNVIHINIKLITNSSQRFFDKQYLVTATGKKLIEYTIKPYHTLIESSIQITPYTMCWWEFLGTNGAWSGKAKEICEQLEKELRDETNQH